MTAAWLSFEFEFTCKRLLGNGGKYQTSLTHRAISSFYLNELIGLTE